MAIEKFFGQFKIDIEINIVGDGKIFLNFWDYIGGNDITVELKDNKLYQNQNGCSIEISLQEFVEKIYKITRTM